MAKVDIAAETLKVGNALTSVRIDNMILNLAKGIAWGQFELDKVGVEITKLMGMPGIVSIGGEKLSMLDAGFVPSFYHFVDTILEIKMDVKIREEENSSEEFKMSQSGSSEVETSAEVSASVGYNAILVSAEAGFKAGYKSKTQAAYSTALDAKHAQTFSQDLSASSSMKTKLVPVPPPELLVERIKILLEKLRKESESDAAAQVLTSIVSSQDLINALNDNNTGVIKAQIVDKEKKLELTSPVSEKLTEGTRWQITDTHAEGEDKYFIEKDAGQLKVYKGSAAQKKSMDQILLGKVEDKLLERVKEK